MAKLSLPRGTSDVLPEAWRLRQPVLDAARTLFERAGYGRISTPTFEHTELFERGVGEGTDIVGKEMYTFRDRSERSLTLRPEGTAPVMRAFVEHGLHREPLPVKLWYFSPMFRYEKPQEGRYREHYQLGCEAIGSEHPATDAELITLLDMLFTQLRVPGITLRLNTIGDADCRPAYRELLVGYLQDNAGDLCEECTARIRSNPLRTFDCKNPQCRAVMADAPVQAEHLCSACEEHFAQVCELLSAADVQYTLDPTVVRGLDYYTRTTFEFSSAALGAQDACGGGGRYDGLSAQLGGPAVPGVGFGAGIERIVLALQAGGAQPAKPIVDVYLCSVDDAGRSPLAHLARMLRMDGHNVEMDLVGRSLKGQLKQASRLHARFAVVADADGLRIQAMHGREEWKTTERALLRDVRAALSGMSAPGDDLLEQIIRH